MDIGFEDAEVHFFIRLQKFIKKSVIFTTFLFIAYKLYILLGEDQHGQNRKQRILIDYLLLCLKMFIKLSTLVSASVEKLSRPFLRVYFSV